MNIQIMFRMEPYYFQLLEEPYLKELISQMILQEQWLYLVYLFQVWIV